MANQYRILEALSPEDAQSLRQAREALEQGFALEYDSIAVHIYDEPHTLTEEECKEVINILSMFDALDVSYKALADKMGLDEWAIRFRGFDGNTEGKQMAYARYFCGLDGGRFTNLHKGDNFNSHMPMLSVYRRMVAAWKEVGSSYDLSKDQMARIYAAGLAKGEPDGTT